MNIVYSSTIRSVKVKRLTDQQYQEVKGIPQGLEQHEIVRLTADDVKFMMPAAVVHIDYNDDTFYLSFLRHV